MAHRLTTPPRTAIAMVRPLGGRTSSPDLRRTGGRTNAITLPTSMAPPKANKIHCMRSGPPNMQQTVYGLRAYVIT
jgi:hypothetical protein